MAAIYQSVGKRSLDVLASLLAATACSPLFLMISCLIAIRMGRPVLFSQERPGQDCRTFRIYKFRTMTNQCGPDGELLTDADRLTSLGKFLRSSSLDELPELVNVIKGDMSLVGPRPLLVAYLPLYSAQQIRRQQVRPGLTGWAQVNGRNDVPWDDKLAMDVWYVDHLSFLLDLRIIGRTLLQVLKRNGISSAGHATTPPFDGSSTE